MSSPDSTASSPPAKPYPGFPLFAHANGQWAKKIRGKLHYFGPWTDYQAALTRYLKAKDDLEAGRRPPSPASADTLTVEQMVCLFLTERKLHVESGELDAQTWTTYEDYGKRLCRVLGKDTPVASLTPDDFRRYRTDLQKTHKSLETLKADLTKTKVIFNWAGPGPNGQGYLDRLPRFGTAMKAPSRKAMLKERQERGERVLSAAQINALLAKAGTKLRAMILLGINCGFGNGDCAKLTLRTLDLVGGWANFPRPKTGVTRRNPLWPETVAALQAVLAARKPPSSAADAQRVFITKYGHSFRSCAIGFEFEKLAEKLGYTRGEADFYDLRRTCISVGLQINDDDAVRTLSGHQRRSDDMLGVYNRMAVSEERLRKVTEHIRAWLYSGAANSPSESSDEDGPVVLPISARQPAAG
jgi:integrase